MREACITVFVVNLALVGFAWGEVILGISDTDGEVNSTSTVAAPGQSFTINVDLGVTGGEMVGGVTFLLRADQNDVLRITGRTLLSTILSDATTDTLTLTNPASNLLAAPNGENPLDIGSTSNTPALLGVTMNETVMSLTLQVEPGTPPGTYPIHLTFSMARWATLGEDSISAAMNTNAAVYTIFPVFPPVATAAESRKVHSATTYAIPLPLAGSAGVECRNLGPTQVVVTYDKSISGSPSVIASAVGGAAPTVGVVSVAGNQLTINLSGAADKTCISLTINGVTDALNPGAIAPAHVVKVGALYGDVNGNRSVNAADIGLVKSQSGQAVGAGNFRYDLNHNGAINAADVGLVKSRSGNSIAACSN